MKTDENCIMPLDRIARAYHYLTEASRYLFSDSRQRFITYFLIVLCFLTSSTNGFVLYQGTSPKLDTKDLSMIREMKVEDRRTVYEFCKLVINFPELLSKKLSEPQLLKSKPICQQLLLGIKKVRESEKANRVKASLL